MAHNSLVPACPGQVGRVKSLCKTKGGGNFLIIPPPRKATYVLPAFILCTCCGGSFIDCSITVSSQSYSIWLRFVAHHHRKGYSELDCPLDRTFQDTTSIMPAFFGVSYHGDLPLLRAVKNIPFTYIYTYPATVTFLCINNWWHFSSPSNLTYYAK